MKKNIIITAARPWTQKKVKEFKHEETIIHIITERSRLTTEAVKKIEPNYIFFPHWSWYIPEEIYNNYNCIVFHPTDVPFGRGGSPIQNLIAAGYTKTVLSAIKVAKDIDAGEIYLKRELSLLGGGEEILIRMQNMIFDEMIPHILDNNIIPKPQSGDATIFKRRTPQMSELSPDLSIDELFDMIRMLDIEGYPQAFIKFGEYTLSFSRPALRADGIDATVKIAKGNIIND